MADLLLANCTSMHLLLVASIFHLFLLRLETVSAFTHLTLKTPFAPATIDSQSHYHFHIVSYSSGARSLVSLRLFPMSYTTSSRPMTSSARLLLPILPQLHPKHASKISWPKEFRDTTIGFQSIRDPQKLLNIPSADSGEKVGSIRAIKMSVSTYRQRTRDPLSPQKCSHIR